MKEEFVIRRARPEDRDALRSMQELCMRTSGRSAYSDRQIEAFLRHVGTMDDFLLHEGTYAVAEICGLFIASEGWSDRAPRYAKAAGAPSQASAPVVRSVFVHPEWQRRGLGRALMRRAEEDARVKGFAELGLTALLSGVPLYASLGYAAIEQKALSLPGGVILPVVTMRKPLGVLSAAAMEWRIAS